jgi:hypothetical protein
MGAPYRISGRRSSGARHQPYAACAGDHGAFTRKALLIAQATVSVVLVAGATKLARSLGNLERQASVTKSRDGLSSR